MSREGGQDRKEMFLSNVAFLRFAGGFELYQKLLSSDQDVDKEKVKERMSGLFSFRSDPNESLVGIIKDTLAECENGQFSIDGLANKIAGSLVADAFLKQWNHKGGEVEEGSGMMFANEIVAYENKDNNKLSLHIRPAGVGSDELLTKVVEGFRAVAEKLKTGELGADAVMMKSWMFGGRLGEYAKQMLGEDVAIENVDPEDPDVLAIQHLALYYNNRSLEKYLKSGEKPEVKQVSMSKDEFVGKFGS